MAALLAVATGQARADSAPPHGIPAGPWVIAPLVVVGYSYESNVLYQSPEQDPTSDELTRTRAAIVAHLPFRASLLSLSAQRDWRDYNKTKLVGPNTADEFRAEVGLKFPTGDRLQVTGDLTNGIADTTVFDPGGEALFRGEPFRYWEGGFDLSRETTGRRGYGLRWEWRSLEFDRSEQESGFYDYDGWSGGLTYREPLTASIWLTASYDARRYDHFCFGIDVDGQPCPAKGTPFRKERGDVVFAGLQGTLARQRPYTVKVGWGVLQYDGGASSDFRGLLVDGQIRLRTAAASRLDLSFQRRPWGSFYTSNNYYMLTFGEVDYKVDVPGGFQVGLKVGYLVSAYPEPVPIDPDGSLGRRTDKTFRAEAYANLLLRQRFGIRFSVLSHNRQSTDALAEFDAETVFLGMFYGWY